MEGAIEKKKEESMRDVSQLPEDIIHSVLSYLETKKTARTSIFCKTWYSAWLTCPTLVFGSESSTIECSEMFFKFIKNTLRRYQEHKLCILQLVLHSSIFDFYSPSLVGEWIGIAVKKGIERLQLNFYMKNWSRSYTLPSKLFESETLRELTLRCENMKLTKGVGDKVKCTRLQKLHLLKIDIDDEMFHEMFQDIIECCPLIENLCVNSLCENLKRIKVTKLYNLKEFTFCSWGCYKFIEIEAPDLQHLQVNLRYGSLKLHNTEKLKYLEFANCTLSPSTFLYNFMRKFPQLIYLSLSGCNGIERIDISSRSLKHITLCAMENLKEVTIDAPSMISFEFVLIKVFPDVFLVNASNQWVSKISTWKGTHQFYKLKGILTKLIESKISVELGSCFDDLRMNIPICPVVKVEKLHLDLGFRTLLDSSFFDALFLTCHPKAIILIRYLDDGSVANFLYENLIERRNQDRPTNDDEKKSWRQELKEVKVEVCDISKEDWHPCDWNSLPWPPQVVERVQFMLEWEAKLA